MRLQYDDMLYLPHPVSARHPQMPRRNRAAQFAPFASLKGYAAAIEESARLTVEKPELDETAQAALDAKLRLLARNCGDCPEVDITYFLPDPKKAGGACVTQRCRIRRVDPTARALATDGGARILIDDILNIDGALFALSEIDE